MSARPPDQKSGGLFSLSAPEARGADHKSDGLFLLALTLLCAALYLPGVFLLPPIDRDEARFMQATKQMIETGDYGHIRFQTEPRDKKPIGAHWAQAAAVKVFGQTLTTPWPYRLPSVLGVWIAVIVTAWSMARVVNPTVGLMAGAILATTLLTAVEAHLAKADALLLGCSAVVFAGLLRAASAPIIEPVLRYGFWVALGFSVLIKGPILPLVLILALIAHRSFDPLKKLEPTSGLAIVVAIVATWPLAVSWTEVMRFMQAAFTQDLLPKLMSGQESHGAPPGTHALLSIATLWPWSFALPITAVMAWRERASPLVRLCVAWIVPFWLVLEVTPTKLPHYVLPLFPAVAVLMAITLQKWSAQRTLLVGVTGLVAAAGLVLAAIPIFNLPRWDDLNISQRLTAAINQHRAPEQTVVLVGYSEPSAVFLLGTETITTNAEHAAGLLTTHANVIAAVEQNDLAGVEAIVTTAGQNLVRLGAVSGTNYSRGTPVTLILVTARANSGP